MIEVLSSSYINTQFTQKDTSVSAVVVSKNLEFPFSQTVQDFFDALRHTSKNTTKKAYSQ